MSVRTSKIVPALTVGAFLVACLAVAGCSDNQSSFRSMSREQQLKAMQPTPQMQALGKEMGERMQAAEGARALHAPAAQGASSTTEKKPTSTDDSTSK